MRNPLKNFFFWFAIYFVGVVLTVGKTYHEFRYEKGMILPDVLDYAGVRGMFWPVYWPMRLSIDFFEPKVEAK